MDALTAEDFEARGLTSEVFDGYCYEIEPQTSKVLDGGKTDFEFFD